MDPEARILDRDLLGTGAPQRAADQDDPLGDPGAHEHAVGRRQDAAHAAEVRRGGLAQRLGAAAVGIAELGIGQLRQRGAVVARPELAREQGRVREPAEQAQRRGHAQQRWVDGDRVHVRAGRVRAVARLGAHARAGALARLEVAVGDEIRERLDDDAARHAELRREHARGRQRGPLEQAPAHDRRAQTLRQLERLRAAGGGPQLEQQVAGELGGIGIGMSRHGRIGL